MIEEKIRRICTAYADVNQCDVVEINFASLHNDILENEKKKQDIKDFIKNTAIQFKELLKALNTRQNADVSVFKVYKLFLLREKQIYIHLNMLN